MLKPLVAKFRSDLSVHLRDIAEKQVPAKLKPIVNTHYPSNGKILVHTRDSANARFIEYSPLW